MLHTMVAVVAPAVDVLLRMPACRIVARCRLVMRVNLLTEVGRAKRHVNEWGGGGGGGGSVRVGNTFRCNSCPT